MDTAPPPPPVAPPSVPEAPVPRKRSRILPALLATGGLTLACGCCGGIGLMLALPDLLVRMVLEGQPLEGRNMASPPMSPEERQAVAADAADGTVELTPEQLLRMSADDPGADVDVLELAIDAEDRVRLDLSVRTAPSRWLNVHSLVDVEIDQGRLTRLVFDELDVGPWSVGQYIRGRDLSAQVQQDLDQRAAETPELTERMRALEKVRAEEGRFVVTLTPGGLDAFLAD